MGGGNRKGPRGGFDLGTPEAQLRHMSAQLSAKAIGADLNARLFG